MDTGSSNTIFDIDVVEEILLIIDPIKGKARRMYGVGGQSELCYEQAISNLTIEDILLEEFVIQLGITKENYGFEAILRLDFLLSTGASLDFKELLV